MANKRWVDNSPLRYLQYYLFGIKPFVHKSTNQAIVDLHSKSYSIENSSFMQVCQILNPETLNSISSWSFPVSDFSTLLRNHLPSNNQAPLLLKVIFYLQFFQPLFISIISFTFTSCATPKHSTLICIRYFISFFGFSIQLSKQLF